MWENAYLSIKNPKASRARLRALDPGHKLLASLERLRFATSATFGLSTWGPPPRPNPGSAPARKHLFSGWASCTKSSNCSPNCKGWSRRVKENNSNLTVEISLHVCICWLFVGSQSRSKYDFVQYMMVKHFVMVYHWCRYYFPLESKFEPAELQSSSKLGQKTLPWSYLVLQNNLVKVCIECRTVIHIIGPALTSSLPLPRYTSCDSSRNNNNW